MLRKRSLGTIVAAATGGLLLAHAARAEGPGKLTLDEIKKELAAPGAHETFVPEAPLGIDPQVLREAIPAKNPLTRAKVSLGKQLYFDGRLSKDGTISCASCHAPDKGWADGRRFSAGVGGKLGGRSAPSVTNRVLGKVQFWDGRAATLEDQALGPIQNPIEMAETHDNVVKKLNAVEGYRLQFEKVFGGPATAERIGLAIAAFERTVLSGGSRVDLDDEVERFASLDPETADADTKKRAEAARAAAAKAPLTESEKRGKKLFFGKASCSLCHAGMNYSDELFHNLGVGSAAKDADKGRMDHTKKPEDEGKFRTPGLRNIADTAPYMHDGSEPTLEAVVELYDKGGVPNPKLSDRMKPLKLTAQDKADLVAFLKALSGNVTKVEAPKLP